jgi:hypothetical protein
MSSCLRKKQTRVEVTEFPHAKPDLRYHGFFDGTRRQPRYGAPVLAIHSMAPASPPHFSPNHNPTNRRTITQ